MPTHSASGDIKYILYVVQQKKKVNTVDGWEF